MNLVVIGSAPSSGSTLVADLLNAVPGFACPPELYTFCFKSAISFDAAFKQDVARRSPIQPMSCYAAARPWFSDRALPWCGLDLTNLIELVDRSSDLLGFSTELAKKVSAQLGRDVSTLCEKTPINVETADVFCASFPHSRFLHVTRDGRAVVASLKRRGFTLYEAAMIWLNQTYLGLQASGRPNYLQVNFEEVAAAPYEAIARLSSLLNPDLSVDPGAVETTFIHSVERSNIPRPRSWQRTPGQVSELAPAETALPQEEASWLMNSALYKREDDGTIKQIISANEAMVRTGYTSTTQYSSSDYYLIADEALHRYIRYSKNLVHQSQLRVLPEAMNFPPDFDAERRLAFRELDRIRRKLRKSKASGSPR